MLFQTGTIQSAFGARIAARPRNMARTMATMPGRRSNARSLPRTVINAGRFVPLNGRAFCIQFAWTTAVDRSKSGKIPIDAPQASQQADGLHSARDWVPAQQMRDATLIQEFFQPDRIVFGNAEATPAGRRPGGAQRRRFTLPEEASDSAMS